MRHELRPHQKHAIALLRSSLGSGHTRPMLQAPTGAGKTMIAAAIVAGARAKGNRVIFVVPALSLINQTVERFYAEGIFDVGVIQGDHPMTDYSKPVQVASVQTLQNRRIPDADIVIIDEAHKWFKFYGKWMSRWDAVPFIGLSATPWTKGLGKHYDDLLIACTTQELIDNGYLSDFRVFAPSHPDLSKVRTVAGDYHEGDLGSVMNQNTLVADVVDTWLKTAENRPTICFAVDRAHAKHLHRQFDSRGVGAAYIDAFTPPEDREAIRDQLHAGQIRVVCNVGCLTTGVDWDVRCIVLARPTKSEMLFVQMIGRGLRTAEGKDFCLVLDHSDTHLRLGFVTDIHHDKLDDGKPKESTSSEREEPLPKDCGKCGFVKPAKVHECPSCGFKPEKQSEVETQKGELKELKQRRKTNREMTGPEKEFFYGELKMYARQQGYSDGWASHKYREKTGVWPNHYASAPLRTPTPETLSWIKSRQIAFAKRRKSA